MARFCKQCNRKFGFFEEDFDGICIECYEKNQEEERIRIIEQERKRKKELEAQRIAYEQKILEEKKLEEQKRSEEQKRLEEQKRIKENEERLRKKEEELQLRIQKRLEKEELRKKRQQEYIEKMQLKRQMEIEKQEEKKKKEKIKIQEIKKQKELKKEKIQKELELEKEKINTYLEIIFNNPVILSIYNEIIIDLTEYSKNNVSEKIVYILKRLLLELPDNYGKVDLVKINTKTHMIEILTEFNENIKENVYLEIDFYKMAYKIAKQENIDNVQEIINSLSGKIIYNKYTINNKYNSTLFIMYELCIYLLYNIIYNQEVINFKKNEDFYNIYNNLSSTISNEEYIVDKLYDMYKNLFKNIFKKNLSKEELKYICYMINNEKRLNIAKTTFLKNETIEIEHIENKGLLKNIRKIEKTTYYKNIKQINVDELTFVIFCVFGGLEREEKIILLENMQKIYNTLSQDLKKRELLKEKERILNGDMSKEIELQKLELDFSNIQNGYEFEEYVANLYKKMGYTIEEVTKKSGDQGADVIAFKDNIKYVIQVKFYNNPVGNKAVQEVVASIGMYKADKGIVVTNSTFTSSAIELSQANNIELVDGEKIEEYKKIIIDKM